jgi:hypothetical protein
MARRRGSSRRHQRPREKPLAGSIEQSAEQSDPDEENRDRYAFGADQLRVCRSAWRRSLCRLIACLASPESK